MSYSLDASSDEGRLRVMLYDVTSVASPIKGTDYFFEDDELTALLDVNNSDLHLAAADGCRALGAYYSAKAIDVGLGKGDIRVNFVKRAEFYIQLADRYQNRSDSGVVEYIDSVAYDVDLLGNDNSEYVGD